MRIRRGALDRDYSPGLERRKGPLVLIDPRADRPKRARDSSRSCEGRAIFTLPERGRSVTWSERAQLVREATRLVLG